MQALSWLPVRRGHPRRRHRPRRPPRGRGDRGARLLAEYRALVLIVLLLAPLVTFEAWRFRRWEPAVLALLVLLGGVAALWPILDWPTWTLATTYAVAGAWAASSRSRAGAASLPISAALAVQALSWLPVRRGHPRRRHRPRRPPRGRGDRGARYRRVPRAGADRAAAGAADHLRGVALPPLGAGRGRAAGPAWLRRGALAGLRLADVDTCRHLRSRRRRAASSRSPAGAAMADDAARARRESAFLAARPPPASSPPLIALDVRLGDAAIEAPGTAEYRTLVLVVLLLAPLITFEAWRFRRWEPGVAALLILLACVAALWPVFDWPTWTLAATYAVAGAGGFVALTRWRRVAGDSAALAVQALSWLPARRRHPRRPHRPRRPPLGRGVSRRPARPSTARWC